jgi:hypothetical protein
MRVWRQGGIDDPGVGSSASNDFLGDLSEVESSFFFHLLFSFYFPCEVEVSGFLCYVTFSYVLTLSAAFLPNQP